MLEPCLNQAAGLQGLAPEMAPKLVAVSSHGNQLGELPLLWSLCTTWVDMGLPIMVLDGHTHESAQNPGLLHLLDDSMSLFPDDQEPVAWSVLPAMAGFKRLVGTGFNTDTVGDLFRKFAVVVLYAPAETLCGLINRSGLTPLLVVTPLKASSLTAYQAMKQLLLDAHLHPTVANITLKSGHVSDVASPARNLQDCALSFLGLTVKPVTVSATETGHASRDEISRLALQLLESAVFLERQPIQRTH